MKTRLNFTAVAAMTAAALSATSMIAVASCARRGPDNAASPVPAAAPQNVTQPEVPLDCTLQPGTEPLAERTSPFDSTRIAIRGRVAQVCYSRPSVRGRVIFGGLLPYGNLWRTGANEPTILHLNFTARIAGLRVEPGSYSIYTIPAEKEWTVIVNRSISQWGYEGLYKPEIQAQEVGRVKVPSEHLDDQVEKFVIRPERGGTGTVDLVLEWERTRVRIPIQLIGG